MNQAQLNEHIGRTLWGPDGSLLETIDRSHILTKLWETWTADPASAKSYTTALPGPASQTRNAEDRSGKPMTRRINFVPYTINGVIAIQLPDAASLDVYLKWREMVDSKADYDQAMLRRGRYTGRQNRMGV